MNGVILKLSTQVIALYEILLQEYLFLGNMRIRNILLYLRTNKKVYEISWKPKKKYEIS